MQFARQNVAKYLSVVIYAKSFVQRDVMTQGSHANSLLIKYQIVDIQQKPIVLWEKSKFIAIKNALKSYLAGIHAKENVVIAKKWDIQHVNKIVREIQSVDTNVMNGALKIVLHANKNARQSVLIVNAQKYAAKYANYALNPAPQAVNILSVQENVQSRVITNYAIYPAKNFCLVAIHA